MSVTSETVITQTAGNGSTTRYYFTFTIYEDTDLLVKVINDTTEAETTLTLNSDYTVSVSGKYIDLTSGTLCPSGSTLNLISDIPYTQETELQDGGDWSASVFNFVFDKMTRLILQLKAAIVNFVTLDDVKNDSDVASAIALKHSNALDHSNSLDHSNALDHAQNTDTYLNYGGGNQVSAAQAKTAYTHSQTAAGNPHSVTKSDIGLGNVDNKSEATIIADVKADSDVADAISKKHDASLHIAHSLATAVNDFLVASGAGAFVKKTLAEVKAILGLGTVAYLASDADGTLAANSDDKIATQKAVKTYADTKALASHNHSAAAITSDTLDGDRLPAISTTKKGAVPATGEPSGKFLKDDGSWASAAGGGDVSGPASSTDNAITRFDGTGGKTIQNSSVTIDDNGSVNIPTGQSYKINGAALAKSDMGLGNVDNVQQMPASYLDTDTALAANSDSKVPSQKAIKAYCDNLISANDAMVYKGVIDCSGNPNYPAASQGHTYKISVAGKIGGASGVNVENGDTIICITDTAAGTQAAVGANWTIIQSNIDGAVIGPASVSDGYLVLFDGVTGKLIKAGSGAPGSMAYETASNYILKSLFDAYTILYADTDNTPAALTVSASTFVGRKASGGVSAMSASEARAVLNVADGATANSKASSAETNTGTDDAKFITPDALAGSNFGIRYVEILVNDSTALTTGDGKAYFRVPAGFNGMNLVSVAAHCGTASSSGTPTFQIRNVTDSADMLSTKLTIDATENDSKDATAAAVIDTTKDDVATGDFIAIDCDVSGTGTAWVIVELGFQLP